MVSRRRALRAAASALAAGLAGCLESSPGAGERTTGSRGSPTPSPTESAAASPTGSPAASPTGSPAASPTGSPAASPAPDVRTPAPGECAATDPPKPATGAGLPDPRDYPEGPPEMTAPAVASFLAAYEEAYAFNRLLAELAADGDCVESMNVYAGDVEVRRAGEGFAATVPWGGSTTGAPCPDATGSPTPGPHRDYVDATDYYVTERFLLRAATVLECW